MNLQTFRKCGFRRVAAVTPTVKVADVEHNVGTISGIITSRRLSDVSLAVFPELCVTGYTCADLFLQQPLIEAAEKGVERLVMASAEIENKGLLFAIGAPVAFNDRLYNCALFILDGEIAAIIPKIHIPNYGEYYERRWFESGKNISYAEIDYAGFSDIPFGTDILLEYDGLTIGAEICEDLWVPAPPSCRLAMAGADVIANLSASNESLGKSRYRRDLILQQSARCRCAYLYASAGAGESSTDLAFPGYTAIAENGRMLSQSLPFSEPAGDSDGICHLSIADIDIERLHNERRKFNTFADNAPASADIACIKLGDRFIDETEQDNNIELVSPEVNPMPFVPSDPTHRDENCTEIINIQCYGLLQRIRAINCSKLVIGVSGGLDSTLALLIAVRTLNMAGIDPSNVYAITMPGLATTNRTHSNAWQLMERLGCTCLEIPIGAAVAQHFNDIGQDPEKYDATYENSQARERTQILMDYANKVGGIVVGTGDLSELALGWCTYNGDHMSMYAVNASVPKTLVKYLVEWFALRADDSEIRRTLLDIIDTPISPELVPAKKGEDKIEQKTEDLVGPYELHDFFMFHMLRDGFTPEKILHLACQAFAGRYDRAIILKWERTFYRRFFSQQFKRSCMPDGPKVGSVCLSPRGDWRMPSDASARLWLDSLPDD